MELQISLKNSDCLEVLRQLPDESVDSLVTDPPAGIAFMGKEWDTNKGGSANWIKWMAEIMVETKRVLKPGAHGLVWAIPRTSHWTATALEQAGFEIRDVITHIFGSGFPKSLNIGKELPEFEGFGTALKPASEHWILVRKPLSEKTVVKNVLKYGTGGLNIDESRIVCPPIKTIQGGSKINGNGYSNHEYKDRFDRKDIFESHAQGRFPANLVLSHNEDCDEQCTEGCAVKMLDEQTSELSTHAGHLKPREHKSYHGFNSRPEQKIVGEKGGASRFFYCAKASKKDRNEGLEVVSEKQAQNIHPTVKSTKLMEYLIRLITPPQGTVLDPFMGSGSTGKAAINLDFSFIGIEKEEQYFEIACARIGNALAEKGN